MTVLAVVLGLILAVLAWCIMRFTHARRVAQRSIPRAGEVWTQDGQPLYIIRVENHGVRLRLGGTTQRDEWSETWETWALRVRRRVVLKTELRWKLGGVSER
jgi:hypothetical protein